MSQANVNSQSDLMNHKEVQKYLSIDRTTVWKWRKQGRLKAYGIGRRVYFKRVEVMAALVELNPKEA